MKIKKALFFFSVLTIISIQGNALDQKRQLERKKPLPLKELQNPNSPSYVPFPYPTTREEIVADLKYAIKRLQSKKHAALGGYEDILMKLLVPNPGINIAEIEKVMNRTLVIPDDYLFFIVIRDNEGLVVARASLVASGLFYGSADYTHSPKGSTKSLITDAEALKEILAFLNVSAVRKIDRIFMADRLFAPYPFTPAWEIEALDSSKYYLAENGRIYKLRNAIEGASRKDLFSQQYISTNDQLIVYDELYGRLLFLDKLK